ncbi:TetR/AcrR family transcriptional regulator [Flindersiella endophytica]
MKSTKIRALEAAVDLVGSQGLRALTHARVDARAGLPKGSTSNHFRTRAALLGGVLDWILERELPQVDTALAPASAGELVDGLCEVLDYLTGVNRPATTARLALFLEAGHDEQLRTAVSRGRALMEAAAVSMLARLGAADPVTAAGAIAACSEGLILHRIARHDETDPRPIYELLVRAAFAPGQSQ